MEDQPELPSTEDQEEILHAANHLFTKKSHFKKALISFNELPSNFTAHDINNHFAGLDPQSVSFLTSTALSIGMIDEVDKETYTHTDRFLYLHNCIVTEKIFA